MRFPLLWQREVRTTSTNPGSTLFRKGTCAPARGGQVRFLNEYAGDVTSPCPIAGLNTL